MKRYSQAKLVFLASSLFTEGGDWRSVYFLVRHLETRGESVVLINPAGKRGLRQFLAGAFYAPHILVNGLGTAMRWNVLLLCLLRKQVCLYLHETGYVLDQHAKATPLKFRLLSRIVRRNPVLCVSKQAEALYQSRFGASRTHVVYECPGVDFQEAQLDPSKTHIVMVGSINHRKGAELFSRVTDLAAEAHPNWQFHWVGGLATMDALYQSPHVIWHGWQWNPARIVEQCALFFLSSIDDPCPLSALEAMAAGLKVVAYKATGTTEMLEGLPGCGVIEVYTPESALQVLEEAIASETDKKLIADRARQFSGIDAFAQRVMEGISK